MTGRLELEASSLTISQETYDLEAMDMTELKSALTKALHGNAQRDRALQPEGLGAPQPSAIAARPCYFLEKLPIEVRNQIYGLLLTNELLSRPEAIGKIRDSAMRGDTWGDNEYPLSYYNTLPAYSLHPAILRACSQIRDEASDILYGSNTFNVFCMRVNRCRPIFSITPLQRHVVPQREWPF